MDIIEAEATEDASNNVIEAKTNDQRSHSCLHQCILRMNPARALNPTIKVKPIKLIQNEANEISKAEAVEAIILQKSICDHSESFRCIQD